MSFLAMSLVSPSTHRFGHPILFNISTTTATVISDFLQAKLPVHTNVPIHSQSGPLVHYSNNNGPLALDRQNPTVHAPGVRRIGTDCLSGVTPYIRTGTR